LEDAQLLPDTLLVLNNLLLLSMLHLWLPAHSNLVLSTIDKFRSPRANQPARGLFPFPIRFLVFVGTAFLGRAL